MAQEENIQTLLRDRALITYVALKGEVPFRDYLSLPESTYEIAPRASLDPEEEAQRALTAVGDTSAAILIPGTRFDGALTRHGRGGGWYDRFLARVPRTWLRVGLCYADQFSSEPLKREAWDQEMDVVCVVDGADMHVYAPGIVDA